MIVGKLVGALAGYLVGGGTLGTFAGAVVGHFLVDRPLARIARGGLGGPRVDPRVGPRAGSRGGPGGGFGRAAGGGLGGASRGAPAPDLQAVQHAFFDATFGVLGHVAKADGRVDPREIALAEALMDRMQLGPARRRDAIRLFDEGKAPDFALDAAVGRLVAAAPGQANLYFTFLQIQVQMALADGEYDPAEERVLRDVAALLGVPALVFRQIEMIARMSARAAAEGFGPGGPRGPGPSGAAGAGPRGAGSAGAGRARPGTGAPSLAEAYEVLGVAPDADRATVKNAWRRQMSEHHPDKLASKGLPAEMLELANERAQAIQRAWERIREAKGWR